MWYKVMRQFDYNPKSDMYESEETVGEFESSDDVRAAFVFALSWAHCRPRIESTPLRADCDAGTAVIGFEYKSVRGKIEYASLRK